MIIGKVEQHVELKNQIPLCKVCWHHGEFELLQMSATTFKVLKVKIDLKKTLIR